MTVDARPNTHFEPAMTPEQLQQRLSRFPRLHYGHFPTPLQPLNNLSRLLHGPRLWIKRDDGVGPATGGNKGRKLEFLMGHMVQQGRQKAVTYGGLQSNHARMTAAACAALGVQAHLFFFEPRPPALQGNLLLDQLCAARLHFIPFGAGGTASMSLEMTDRLVRWLSLLITGRGAYFIPVGGHNVTGCLGYVAAAAELALQLEDLNIPAQRATVVIAAGTGGTLAGLLAGFRLLQSPVRLLGLDIGKLWKRFPQSLARLTEALCARMGQPASLTAAQVPLIEGLYAGPGYARLTPQTVQALHLLAGKEGIILDPVYTGKAFAGLLDLIGKGHFADDEHVIFLHSGGLPGLWAYEAEIQSDL